VGFQRGVGCEEERAMLVDEARSGNIVDGVADRVSFREGRGVGGEFAGQLVEGELFRKGADQEVQHRALKLLILDRRGGARDGLMVGTGGLVHTGISSSVLGGKQARPAQVALVCWAARGLGPIHALRSALSFLRRPSGAFGRPAR
jgi:hypothetical protein